MGKKAFILGLACLLIYGCGDRGIEYEEAKEKIAESMETPESMDYMLATIHADGYISRDNPLVETFRKLLNELDDKFMESEKEIGDLSVVTWKALKDGGRESNLLDIMEGMNHLFSGRPGDIQYAEYLSIYLGMRNKEYSHEDAVKAMRVLFRNRGVK